MKTLSLILLTLAITLNLKSQNKNYIPLKNPTFKNISEAGDNDIIKPKILSYRTDSNKVVFTIDLVSDRNTFYNGLSKDYICDFKDSDFPITKYTIKKITKKNRKPLAIAIVADHSSSLGEVNATALQQAVRLFIKDKKDKDYLSIIKFDTKVRTISEGTSKKKLLNDFQVKGLKGFGKATSLTDAMLMGVEHLKNLDDKEYPEKIVIALTDGIETSSFLGDTARIIQTCRQNKIRVFTVDFGNEIDEDYMSQFAQRTNGYHYHIEEPAEFSPLFKNIGIRLNNQYVIEFPYSSFGDKELLLEMCLKNRKVTLRKNFKVPLISGNAVTLDVKFDFNKATVKEESFAIIKNFSKFVNKYSKIKVELSGHTDTVGSDKYNSKLSKERAEAVKKMLIDKFKVNEHKLIAVGYGKSQIFDSSNMDLNRRVEAKVLEIDTTSTKTNRQRKYEITQIRRYLKRGNDDWENDTVVMKVLSRNKNWKNILAVTDWSSSMYKYGTQVLLWHQYNIKKSGVKYFALFNDGQCISPKGLGKSISYTLNKAFLQIDIAKPYGRSGNIFFSEADTKIDSLIRFFRHVEKTHICNHDLAENTVEALIKAERHFRKYDELILIADNEACVRDIHLVNNIKKPVRVIICGKGKINPTLAEIAYRTKGSLHTENADIDFAKEHGNIKNTLRKYGLYLNEFMCGTPLFIRYKIKVKNKSNLKYKISGKDEFYNYIIKLDKKKDNVFYLPIHDKRNYLILISYNGKQHKYYLSDFRFNPISRSYKIEIK